MDDNVKLANESSMMHDAFNLRNPTKMRISVAQDSSKNVINESTKILIRASKHEDGDAENQFEARFEHQLETGNSIIDCGYSELPNFDTR